MKREELLAEAAAAQPVPGGKPVAVDEQSETPGRTQPPVPAKELLNTTRPTSAPSPADERSTDSMPHPKVDPPGKDAPARVITPSEVPPPVAAPLPKRPVRQPDAAFGPAPSRGQQTEPIGLPRTQPTASRSPVDRPASRTPGTVRTWLFLGLGLFLVLALMAAGLWWLTSDDRNDNEQAGGRTPATRSEPTTTTTTPPDLVDRLPQLPGALNQDSGTYTVAEGAQRKLFGAGEQAVFRDNGVRRVTWKGSTRESAGGQAGFVALAAENKDARAARYTAQELRELSSQHATAVPLTVDGKSVPAYKLRSGGTTLFFAVYHSGTFTVHLSVAETKLRDDEQQLGKLRRLLTDVAAVLPPAA